MRGMFLQLNLISLAAVCAGVAAISSTAVYVAAQRFSERDNARWSSPEPNQIPPWGELITFDTKLEQPEEYFGFEKTDGLIPMWHFPGLAPAQVTALLHQGGLTQTQTQSLFAEARITATATETLVRPDDDLILSLTQKTRGNLYATLAQYGANHYMQSAYYIPEGDVAEFFAGSKVDTATMSLVKKLMYERNGFHYFSDVELVVNRLPTGKDRLNFFGALTRQAVVLARLRIRPGTDLERVLSYWTAMPGVQFKDLKPLLESLQLGNDGTHLSILFLLPPFARERLYTFPMPPGPDEVRADCHWTTMNFFRDPPDDRFSDTAYTTEYIKSHYYRVAQPSRYGDLVLVLKDGAAVHSAVYLAEDLVFTKNGVNYAQPWVLMRLKNIVGSYAVTGLPTLAYFRAREN